ncbi:MAG: hypothetical protein K1X82_02670 [Bacteroidia bacterium]|nr:hypothetical protein [Bacteroidia bacterium]
MKNYSLFSLLISIAFLFNSCKKDLSENDLLARHGIANNSTYSWFPDTITGFGMNSDGKWAMVFNRKKCYFGRLENLMLVPEDSLVFNMLFLNDEYMDWNEFIYTENNRLIGNWRSSSLINITEDTAQLNFFVDSIRNLTFFNDSIWFSGGNLNMNFVYQYYETNSNLVLTSFRDSISDFSLIIKSFDIDQNNNFWFLSQYHNRLYHYLYGDTNRVLVPVYSDTKGYNSLDGFLNPWTRACIQVDESQQVWILFQSKICLYDSKLNSFNYSFHLPYYDPAQHSFYNLFWDKVNKRMWLIGDNNSISYFENNKFYTLPVQTLVGSSDLKEGYFKSMAVTKDGTCVFWGRHQLFVYKPN